MTTYLPDQSFYEIRRMAGGGYNISVPLQGYQPADRDVIAQMFQKKATTQEYFEPLFRVIDPLFEIQESGKISLQSGHNFDDDRMREDFTRLYNWRETPRQGQVRVILHKIKLTGSIYKHPIIEKICDQMIDARNYRSHPFPMPKPIEKLLDQQLDTRWQHEVNLFLHNLSAIWSIFLGGRIQSGVNDIPSIKHGRVIAEVNAEVVESLFWSCFLGEKALVDVLLPVVRWLPFLIPVGERHECLYAVAGR